MTFAAVNEAATEFQMSDEPTLPQWFWELLASARRNLRSLCGQLEQLPQERLREYRAAFDEAKRSVNPYFDWEECNPNMPDWSEDDADDFSAWVVMQGQEFYRQVRGSPDEVLSYINLFQEVEMKRRPDLAWDESVEREEYRRWQRADFIAKAIYRVRFGGELPQQ